MALIFGLSWHISLAIGLWAYLSGFKHVGDGCVNVRARYSQGQNGGIIGPEGLIDVLAVNYQLYCTIGSDSQRVLLVKVMIGLYLFNLQLKVTIHKVYYLKVKLGKIFFLMKCFRYLICKVWYGDVSVGIGY